MKTLAIINFIFGAILIFIAGYVLGAGQTRADYYPKISVDR